MYHKDLDGLKVADRAVKGPDQDEEWSRLYSYYMDDDRSYTIATLRHLGQGIENNPRPVQTRLLNRVIDRRAGLYQRPPSRFLLDPAGQRLDEAGPEHKAMQEALQRAQYDLFWREVDAHLALLYNVVIRFYPSSAEGTVVPRLFAPFNVMRDPDGAVPNVLDMDRRFALKLADGLYEYFERTPAGWTCHYVDEGGSLVDEQPYGPDGVLPYKLPALVLYDRYPAGVPWIPPSVSRSAWVDMTNAAVNDIWALVRAEAHSLKVVATDDTSMVPNESGPGTVWVLPKDATTEVLSNDPKISESMEAFEAAVRVWSISEDLPASEFDKSKQIVTGAARKIEEAPLLNRRMARKMLAEKDERKAYGRFVAVHNYHRDDSWAPALSPDYSLDVEIQPMANPLDAEEAQMANEKGLAMGTRSLIMAMMVENDVGRPEAVRMLGQVKKDNAEFPPPKVQVPGPQPKDETDMVRGPDSEDEQ